RASARPGDPRGLSAGRRLGPVRRALRRRLVLWTLLGLAASQYACAPQRTVQQSAAPRDTARTDAGQQALPAGPGNPPFYDVLGKRYYVRHTSAGYVETGIASWY